MKELKHGDNVLVSLQVGGQTREGAKFYRKPPIERPGVFLRYQNHGRSVVVRLRTIEGVTERVFPVERARRA